MSWDRALADLGGHPLQSALWGDARRAADGIHDRRLMALIDDHPVWMIRIEERRLPLLGWVGWAPRGPTGPVARDDEMLKAVMRRLRVEGMRLVVTDPWRKECANSVGARDRRPRTIWLDLTQGQERLLADLDKQWRYGVRRAHQSGVTTVASHDESVLVEFHGLCAHLSQQKGFRAPSLSIMRALLARDRHDVHAQLLAAQVDGRLAAGSFIIRCGRSAHYFWGATDRELGRSRAGEAVQWASIEWALDHGCTLYDLEGIDPEGNPGTYAFKKKMGGREVRLVGRRYGTNSGLGRTLAWLDARSRP